jgi:hypothetical protein
MKNQVTISWERNQEGDLDVSWQIDPRVKLLEAIEVAQNFSDFLEIGLMRFIERKGIRPSLVEDMDLNILALLEEEEDHVPDTRNMKKPKSLKRFGQIMYRIGRRRRPIRWPKDDGYIGQFKEPKREDYGWHEQSGFDDEQSGWLIEGGEEAYTEALANYMTGWTVEVVQDACEEGLARLERYLEGERLKKEIIDTLTDIVNTN